jgi:hypothetical protein
MRYFVKVFIFAVINIFLFAGLSHAVTFVKEYTYQAQFGLKDAQDYLRGKGISW